MTSKGALLGFYIQLRVKEELAYSPAGQSGAYSCGQSDTAGAEFCYSPEFNGYYVASGEENAKLKDMGTASEASGYHTRSSRTKADASPARNLTGGEVCLVEEEPGFGFYQQLMDKFAKYPAALVKDFVQESCATRQDYSRGVNIMRIDTSGNIVDIGRGPIPLLNRAESESFSVSEGEKRRSVDTQSESDKVLKNAMKSKAHLYKTIAEIPLPSSFNGLITIALFVMLSSTGIMIAEKYVIEDVFNKVQSGVSAVNIQMGVMSTMVQISTWLLQTTAVKRVC